MFQASPNMFYQHSGLPCPRTKKKLKINKNNHGAKLKWTYTTM